MPKFVKFDDFFKHAKFFYTTLGMEAYENLKRKKSETIALNFIFYISFINMNYVMIAEMIYGTLSLVRGQNIMKALFTYSCAGFVVVGSFKIFFIYMQKSHLNDFVHELRRIYPETRQAQKKYHLEAYFQTSLRITLGFSSLYMLALWIYNLLALIEYLIYSKILHEIDREPDLPYYIYIPWQWQGHWSYPVLYISTNLAGYTSAGGHIASDLMLCAFATQLVMHFDFLANSVLQHEPRVEQITMDRKNARDKDLQFLMNVIIYHNHLLDLSNRMNDIFGLPLFFNFFSTTFVLCFVCFQMSVSSDVKDLFKMCLFLIVLMAQVILICHFSQQLIDASLNISDAIYNHNWFMADIRYQKHLNLVIKRAQKTPQLRATTMIPISRATITELLQISYKLFTLLRTMYTQE